jgi:hypothetical protein
MKFLLPLVAAIFTQASARVLYSTDFDDFELGDNQWAANPAWATDNNDSTSGGVNFIDDLAFNQALGKTAGLGLNKPSRNRVRILTQVAHDHVATGETRIEIETLVSIKDSENNVRDDFLFSIYNRTGTRMASIRFDNEAPEAEESDFGFWREDGTNRYDTGFDFIHEELYDLFITIDLQDNSWSASINGIPLFENETFTNAASGDEIVLSVVGYEWDLTSKIPSLFGDNFLFVGDLRVISKLPASPPVLMVKRNENGALTLFWNGLRNRTYQIEYSDSLSENSWKNDLPDSTFTTAGMSELLSYNPPTMGFAKRFFRLNQSD